MTVLRIAGVDYAARPIPPGPSGLAAVRLTKPDGTVYDVIRTRDGLIECDCASFEYRLRGTDRACKHGIACAVAGMVPPARPVPNAVR